MILQGIDIDIDQMKKARKQDSHCVKKIRRKEKQKLLVVIVKLPPPLPTRMNFLQYLSHKVHLQI